MNDADPDIELYDATDAVCRQATQPMIGLDDDSLNETSLNIQNLTVDSQLLASPDSCHTEDVVEKGQLEVKIKKVSVARSNSAVKAGMSCYPMTSKPRGLALIIEINEYENDVHEPRIGSQFDVDNLKKLFSGLGFEVTVKQNLTKIMFDEELNNFSKNRNHSSGHMMILVILSHGGNGHVYTSDGRNVTIESIYEKFNNQFCPLLKGKPKFFIIQACRGDDIDKGALSFTDDPNVSQRKRRMPGTGTDMVTQNAQSNFGEINKARPTVEDMIIAYSTIPGFASIRDHESGTWFIQSLVEVFSNHAHDKELIDLLRMTSERLSQFTNDRNEKQTCNIELRHLYKRIYFNPGYFEDDGDNDGKLLLRNPAMSSPRLMRRSKSTPPASPRGQRTESLCDDDCDE